MLIEIIYAFPLLCPGNRYHFKTSGRTHLNIQIGAIKLNQTLEVVDSFNEQIAPQYYTELHPKVAEITKLSNRDLQKGKGFHTVFGNVKKCAVGKYPKSEKHGNTAQFSEVERSGTQENCGGIGSGCRLRLRPLPVLRRRQSQRVARIDPNAVVVDKNIAENDRFDLFSR